MKKLAAILLLLGCSQLQAQEYKTYPMWDHQQPTTTRVRDLISRLTLEEKVAQMLNAAPAVERLGIPAYDWWNEVLHGVARTPFKVTVFPQAIGMAATWDTALTFFDGKISQPLKDEPSTISPSKRTGQMSAIWASPTGRPISISFAIHAGAEDRKLMEKILF